MKNDKIIDVLNLPHGIEVDLDEGWKKIISRQFGNDDSGRAFGELCQNAFDSYQADTKAENRLLKIESNKRSISIIDFGDDGMNMDRLKHLVTIGGTDKANDSSKIGKFGIGFFSIFNPSLGTKKVIVTTCIS